MGGESISEFSDEKLQGRRDKLFSSVEKRGPAPLTSSFGGFEQRQRRQREDSQLAAYDKELTKRAEAVKKREDKRRANLEKDSIKMRDELLGSQGTKTTLGGATGLLSGGNQASAQKTLLGG